MLCVVFISIGGGGGGHGGDGEGGEEAPAEGGKRILVGGGPSKGPKEYVSEEDANMYLYFSVIAAIVAGFILSVIPYLFNIVYGSAAESIRQTSTATF